jgi:hypothetical protein
MDHGDATIEHGPERRTHPRVVVHNIELIGVEKSGGAVVKVI